MSNSSIDRIMKLQRALNPFSDLIRATQSPTALIDEQLHNLRMLERIVFGPFEEIRQLGSHFHNEILWMREIEKRFYLPETIEVKNLLREFNRIDLAFNDLQNAIKTITTPWLDINNKLQSIDGFVKLHEIGHALRTTSAFDPQLTTALRAKLGDWRGNISWPSEIFTDPLERTFFYEERGFDPTLTAFPATAFQQILSIAGFEEEFAPVTDDEDEEIGLERNNKSHDRLQRFETKLRKFIDTKMKETFGENWIKHQVSGGISKEWKENKKIAERNDPVIRPLIDYADFTHYEHILARNDNWEKVFKPIFCRKCSVQESLRRLYPIRNCVMHGRMIIQDDELYLRVEIMRIQRAMDDAI